MSEKTWRISRNLIGKEKEFYDIYGKVPTEEEYKQYKENKIRLRKEREVKALQKEKIGI